MQTENNKLTENLKKIGFEKTEFETVSNNRFIVKIDTVPSYLVYSIEMPNCIFYRNKEMRVVEPKWDPLVCHLYNPVDNKLEKLLLALGSKDDVSVEMCYLDVDGEITTHWKFRCELTAINYGIFNWKKVDDDSHNTIKLIFKVKETTL